MAPLAALVLHAGVSRTREYTADLHGVALTGDPGALASALPELQAGVRRYPLAPHPAPRATRALLIPDPFRPCGPTARLSSTHPPLHERIARLERLRWPGLSGSW